MFMRIGITLACLLLAGCDGTADGKGTRIDGYELIRIARQNPYGCSGYDPVSDTCSSLSTMTPDGATFYSQGKVLFPADPPIEVTGGMRFIMTADGRLCGYGDKPRARATGGTADQRKAAEAVIKGSFEAFRLLCSTFYERDDGQIYSLMTDADGRSVPIGEEIVYFFDRPKTLRPAF
ncbi:hypothetical protein [Salipiger sp.]|uniref:hypothetical protein n=1 Tax=Salipiger sp. TaxID=2078585 RepID=UPI003A9811C8